MLFLELFAYLLIGIWIISMIWCWIVIRGFFRRARYNNGFHIRNEKPELYKIAVCTFLMGLLPSLVLTVGNYGTRGD